MSQNNALSLGQRLVRSTGLQLVLVAGSFSLLTYTLGRNSGIQQSEAYRTNLSITQIREQLSGKLRVPMFLNDLNASAIDAQPELLTDYDTLGNRFWRQLTAFPVDYINYGAPDGSFLGLERSSDGDVLLYEDSTRLGRGQLTVFSLSARGERLKATEIIPDMSATHEEAWYVDTVAAGRSTWSSIYSWEDQPEIHSVSYNTPLFGGDGRLLGVIGVDMVINQLSTWLHQVWGSRDGLALLVEADGRLIASSDPDIPLTRAGEAEERSRLEELQHPLAEMLHQIHQKPGDSPQPQLRHHEDGAFLLQSTPWGRDHGLDWVLLTASGANEEVTQAGLTLAIELGAAVLALGFALLLNRNLINRILQPLTALRQASQTTEEQINRMGEARPQALQYRCELDRNSGQELLELNVAVQSMVKAFNQLTNNLSAKEEQITRMFRERRLRDEQALAQMNHRLKVSLEAAAIAHEINQPLSVLRLTAQRLQHRFRNRDDAPDPSELQQSLQILDDQAGRIARTTDQIKAILRNANTSLNRLDLRDVLDSVTLYVNSNLMEARGWISTALPPELDAEGAWVDGDAVQLQIAVINLVKNAVDALLLQPPATEAPEIVIRLEHRGQHWAIVVDDNGPGLPEEHPGLLPLSSSKPSGSGLGLFIIRSAMESHDGDLLLGVSPRGGARAVLLLPRQT